MPGSSRSAPAGKRRRIFFALLPPRDVHSRIDTIARKVRRGHELTGDIVDADRFHVTLHFLGDHAVVPPDLIERALAAAAKVVAAPFDIYFDQVNTFGGDAKPVIVLRNGADMAGLVQLHRALGICLRNNHLGQWTRRRLAPHLTLFYADGPLKEEVPVEPIGWQVTDFVLIESMSGYRELGRWPLEG